MEKLNIENKSQAEITKSLKDSFKKYENHKRSYDEELNELGKAHLSLYKQKIDNAVKKIENTQPIDKQKYSTEYNKLNSRLTEARNNIYNKTIKLDLGFKAYTFHHDEHLNAIGAEIDNYENDAINTVNDLIDAINNEEQVQGEKNNVDNANKKRTYVEIDDNGIYKLTKYTNKPKIHEVLGTIIKPGELWKIDYSSCKNQSIKDKMASAISSSSTYAQANSNRFSCYLQYDPKKNTYVISDGNGNILPQRALIRDGVELTPPSKIKGEAKLANLEQQKTASQEANRTNLTDKEKQDLIDSMPKKLKEAIPSQYLNEFFSKTEKDINDRIKEAKYLGYEPAATPVSKIGYTKNGKLLEIHLINGESETKKDLITSKLSDPLFKVLDSHETELVQYMTSRIYAKRGKFDYLTKRESVTDNKEGDNSGKLPKEQKEFSIYGLGLLQQWADNTFNKIGNTNNKEDRKYASLKKYISDSLYTLENSNNITQNDLKNIQKKLSELMPININNLNELLANILGINTNRSELDKYEEGERQQKYENLKDSAKANAISSIRKIGDSRTLFDNAETTFLRDEILSDVDDTNIDMENDDYEKYFKKIYELYSLPEPKLTEGEEFDTSKIINAKKEEFENLYKYAHKNEDDFLKFLIDKKLLPPSAKEKKIKEKVKELKLALNQQEKAANNFEITGDELRNRFKSEQANLQLKSDLSKEEKEKLNQLDFILAQENDFFDNIAKEETEKTRETIKYVGIESTVKSKLAPYLIQKGGGIKGINNSDIYNDSVGAGGFFDRTDENCAKIGPVLKEIIVEVVITAVSIALAWNGAGEAIYGAFTAAKLAAKAAKGIQKVLKFMAVFAKTLAKNMATQYAAKFTVRAAKAAKATGNITRAAKIANTAEKISSASKIIKGSETFGSFIGKAAIRGTSLVIEGTTFHISNTIIDNIINGNRLSEGLDLNGYTEGPDGEKMPNRRNYAQSIAFLGVLKAIGQPIGKLSGKAAKGILRTEYPISTAEKMLSNALSITGEMGSMMGTDQILSLTFDQKFKSVTAEDLITMFGMVVGLRLTNIVNIKFQQYDKKGVTIEMKQGENTFNVRMDREGNVLKIDGKDSTGKKILNPENELGIKSRDGKDAQNLRETYKGKEVGTVKGDIKQLDNLHEGDVITVKHGESDVKFRKNKNGNREIIDSGNIKDELFNSGEEFIAKENSDGSGYHLESKTSGGPKISLDGKVGVKLGTNQNYEGYTKQGIPNQLDEHLGNYMKNNGKKLDFKQFTESLGKASQFIEGVHEWLKRITSNPGIKIPKEFFKDLGEKIREISRQRGNKLDNYHNKLADKLNKFIEKKLSKNGDNVEIKKEEVDKLNNELENEDWLKEQRKHASEFENLRRNLVIKNKIRELPENLRSNTMKKLLEINSIYELSQEEIKQIQKEIGLETSDINGIVEGKTFEKLEEYIILKQWGSFRTAQEKRGFLREEFRIEGLTDTYIQSLNKEQISRIKQLIDLGFDPENFIGETINIRSNYTQEQVNTLKILHKMGVDVSQFPGKLSKFTPVQIETLKVLKESGIEINRTICDYVKDITPDEMEILVQDNPNYEGYNYRKEELNAYHNYKRGRIIEKIQQYIQNTINENRNIGNKEVIDKIRTDLITLPAKERIDIIKTITNVISKVNTINHYLDFKNGPYKTPKELLCAMRGISNPSIISQITNDITVIKHGSGMHFFVGDERSYQIIHDCGLKDSGERSGGFNCTRSKIKQLEGTLSVSNGKNPGTDWNKYEYGTIWHEGQHNWNSYFMSDKTSNRPAIVRAKDEITAYLRDGRGIFKKEKWGDTIEQILTEGKSEGGLYTYGLEGKAWEAHKAHVRELLRYANDLVELSKNPKTGLTKDKIISMLSDVPEAGWKDLHANITKAVNLHLNRNASQREIMSLRENFISKIKERASNNKLITDLINWWNSLFPNHNINLEEFRWAGTTELKTVIENIGQCKSIDKIKHVLKDPKYSHISRGPNNKGGIEISAMIDEVIAGRLPITYIPVEIRPQIQKFIS